MLDRRRVTVNTTKKATTAAYIAIMLGRRTAGGTAKQSLACMHRNGHAPEPPAAPRLPLHHDSRGDDAAVGREQVEQVLVAHVVCDREGGRERRGAEGRGEVWIRATGKGELRACSMGRTGEKVVDGVISLRTSWHVGQRSLGGGRRYCEFHCKSIRCTHWAGGR